MDGTGMSGKFRPGMDGTGKYGEIFRSGTDGTGNPGIPVPYRSVREIFRTVATLVFT